MVWEETWRNEWQDVPSLRTAFSHQNTIATLVRDQRDGIFYFQGAILDGRYYEGRNESVQTQKVLLAWYGKEREGQLGRWGENIMGLLGGALGTHWHCKDLNTRALTFLPFILSFGFCVVVFLSLLISLLLFLLMSSLIWFSIYPYDLALLAVFLSWLHFSPLTRS